MKGVVILCMYNGMLLFDWYINEDIQGIYRYMYKHEDTPFHTSRCVILHLQTVTVSEAYIHSPMSSKI